MKPTTRKKNASKRSASELSEKLIDLRTKLNDYFRERTDQVNSLIGAILLRQHALIVGPPGTAKSMLAVSLFKAFTGCTVFSTQLAKTMTREDVFGPINVKLMREKGFLHHMVENGLADCSFAFLDELFDADSSLLRAIMGVLNERVFTNHTQRIEAPLRTAVATSNFYKTKDEYEAVTDRFLFRSIATSLGEEDSRFQVIMSYLTGGPPEVEELLTNNDLSDLDRIMDEEIVFDDEVVWVYLRLVERLRTDGIIISDRRQNQAFEIAAVDAFLEADDPDDLIEVTYDNLLSCRYGLILVGDPEQERKFTKAFTDIVERHIRSQTYAPILRRAVRGIEKAVETWTKQQKKTVKLLEYVTPLLAENSERLVEIATDVSDSELGEVKEANKKSNALRWEIQNNVIERDKRSAHTPAVVADCIQRIDSAVNLVETHLEERGS